MMILVCSIFQWQLYEHAETCGGALSYPVLRLSFGLGDPFKLMWLGSTYQLIYLNRCHIQQKGGAVTTPVDGT
jgi:hypothetical protein